MQAMLLKAPADIKSSPLELREIDPPEPKSNEIRVRVRVCAVCRTDLHVCEGDLAVHRSHVCPGHQVVGIVDKTGSGARRFKIGDRVGIAWLRETCGQCRYCRSGNENLCPYARFTGYDENGGYGELAVVREDFAYALPPNLDAAEASPLLCAGIIGYRALKRADVRPNSRVGMFGFGSSASIAIQVALHWGCKVYVMSRDIKHQKLAMELGATWAAGSDGVPPEKLDSAIIFAPVGNLVPPAMELLDRGGTLAIAGIHLTDIPPLNYERELFYEKTLRSVTANTRKDGEELLQLGSQIPLKPKITRFALREANRALQMVKDDQIDGTAILEVG